MTVRSAKFVITKSFNTADVYSLSIPQSAHIGAGFQLVPSGRGSKNLFTFIGINTNMKCYNHPTTDAVGTCKHCSKGICHDCITLVDGSVACSTTCVEEVRTVNALIDRNKTSRSFLPSIYFRASILYFLIGFLLIYFGLALKVLHAFFILAGVIFLLGGSINVYNGYKYKKQQFFFPYAGARFTCLDPTSVKEK